jgi:hypothetical protein
MDYWADLWGISYPFPKLDQISVPRIVKDGMENIGLITYWPGFLLSVPKVWTKSNYQQNCMVISHELSHLWFGDTITMPWWSETYNNEGFARYLQYTGCHAIFPEWNTWEEGPSNFFDFAFSIIKQDALGTLRAEIVPAPEVSGSVASISASFKGPTYPKGASVNRMINDFMGDPVWNGALGYHLRKYAFTNPTTVNLMESLDAFTSHKLNIQEKFLPWLTQSGFPVVTIRQERSSITVTQTPCSRYLPEGPEYVWFISLSLSADGNLQEFTYLNFSTITETAPSPGATSFVMGNANHTSYLVVNYISLESQWLPIIRSQASLQYDSVLRGLLLQDIFILAQMSHQDINLPLTMTAEWMGLLDSSLWKALLPSWFELTVALDEERYYASLCTQLSSYLQDILLAVRTNQPGTQSILSDVWFFSALYGDKPVIDRSLTLFRSGKAFARGTEKGSYWAVGRFGNETDFSSLEAQLSSIPAGDTRDNILFGMTATPVASQCSHTLQLIVNSTDDLSQRLSMAKSMLAYNPNCRYLAWRFIQTSGISLLEQEGESASATVLASFDGLLSSPTYFKQAETFLDLLLKRGWVTEPQKRSSLVRISINLDLIRSNTNWQSVSTAVLY